MAFNRRQDYVGKEGLYVALGIWARPRITFWGPIGRKENGNDNMVGSASLDKELDAVFYHFKVIWVIRDRFYPINLVNQELIK